MAAEALFQKSLQDLIKGIRQQKKDGSTFMSQAIVDIKKELKSNDPYIKAEAVSSVRTSKFIIPTYFWQQFLLFTLGSKSNIFAHDWL